MRLALSVLCALIFVSCFKKSIHPMVLLHQKACVENLEAKDYDRARVRCEICLEYDASVPECLNGLGLVAIYENDEKRAISYFSKALRQANNFSQARNNLGVIYFERAQFSKALPFFRSAIKIDPGYTDARYNLALTLLRLGQIDVATEKKSSAQKHLNDSEEQLKRLIEVNPAYVDAYRDIALVNVYLAQLAKLQSETSYFHERAESFFQGCLKIQSDHESCNEGYGNLLLGAQRYEQSLYHFVACLTARKDNSECIKGMSHVYERSNVKREALGRFIELVKKNPEDARGRYSYCSALFEMKFSSLAVEECEAAVKIDNTICEAHHKLAMHYKVVLDPQKALQHCRSYLLCPNADRNTENDEACRRVVIALGGES